MRGFWWLLFLVGCDTDPDGDGIATRYERELGTDPHAWDTDGDALSDGLELHLGSDPLSVDTDGDGYEDGWEVEEGSDPVDPDDGIYEGEYPYNPCRDDVEGSEIEPGEHVSVGEVVPDIVFTRDRFDQPVALHDFAGLDVPLVLTVEPFL